MLPADSGAGISCRTTPRSLSPKPVAGHPCLKDADASGRRGRGSMSGRRQSRLRHSAQCAGCWWRNTGSGSSPETARWDLPCPSTIFSIRWQRRKGRTPLASFFRAVGRTEPWGCRRFNGKVGITFAQDESSAKFDSYAASGDWHGQRRFVSSHRTEIAAEVQRIAIPRAETGRRYLTCKGRRRGPRAQAYPLAPSPRVRYRFHPLQARYRRTPAGASHGPAANDVAHRLCPRVGRRSSRSHCLGAGPSGFG